MLRPFRVRALALAALAAAGCQDYSFNPVGKCMLQPGTQRVRLSDVATADILFVVDESGSMAGEQAKLAANFDLFIENLDSYNAQRSARGLEPIDFHVAVTTTSIFFNEDSTQSRTCRNDCPGAAGQNVCCSGATPLLQAKSCAAGASVCTGGTTCRTDCRVVDSVGPPEISHGLFGEPYCCDGAGVAPETEPIACDTLGARCGTLQQHYDFGTCNAGVAVDGWKYPQGDFVSWTSGANANPRVLHFDKELYTAGSNRQGFTSEQLKNFFVGDGAGAGGNVIVGTCGSGEEQALQAARRAVEKALAGQQRDTYDVAGNLSWTQATRTAGADAEWPHPNAKLVLVFVGDEDDCSSPVDSAGGVVWLPYAASSDTCVDPSKGEMGKQFAVNDLVGYFTSLGRPLGAAFIFPAAQTTCSGEGCDPGLCCASDCSGSMGVCTNNATCGAQSPGNRLSAAAQAFRNADADVVSGSICDPNFGTLLSSIADIVKPPSTLVLPTLPASTAVTVLRISDRAGLTRKTCRGPAPAGTTADAAMDARYDWWFTAARTGSLDATGATQYVHINNVTGDCEANPGETYSADYLGQLPDGGCTFDALDKQTGNDPGTGRDQCFAELGGASIDNWACYAEPGQTTGTCVCCAPGSTTPECQ